MEKEKIKIAEQSNNSKVINIEKLYAEFKSLENAWQVRQVKSSMDNSTVS
jgi:ribosome-associated toxin RatA of RatAB toxin-antitoxin module